MNFISILIAILIFCFLVVIHEFGHFITARIFGVKVNEFAIGMGPKLFQKKGKNTTFSIRALPIGGFCAMQGETANSNPGHEDNQNDTTKINPDESLINKKPWQRAVVLAAGAVMNLVLGGIICLCIFAFGSGQIVTTTVESGTTLQPGDEIVQVNDWNIYTPIDLNVALNFTQDTADFKIKRDGQTITVAVPESETFSTYKIDKTISSVLSQSGRLYCSLSQNIIKSLQYLIIGKVSTEDMSGPVGVVSTMADTTEVAVEKKDATGILTLTALITINLGIFNLLPVPMLDGGHMMFLLIEKIRKKPISEKVQERITLTFMVLLLSFMAYITFHDIIKLFN